MRDIKFRAWHKKLRKIGFFELDDIWYGVETRFDSPDGLMTWDKPTENGYYAFTFREMDEVIIMEFIGLKDKNGVEIYEGDKVRVTDEHGNEDYGVIEYLTERAAYGFRYREDSNRVLDPSVKDVLEVLGNIYEGSELKGTVPAV